jgi:hypothetical protein
MLRRINKEFFTAHLQKEIGSRYLIDSASWEARPESAANQNCNPVLNHHKYEEVAGTRSSSRQILQ